MAEQIHNAVAPVIATLQAEREQLARARNEATLCGGEYLGRYADKFFYRFEIPESIFLSGIGRMTCSLTYDEQVSMEGNIVALHNQYLIIALPHAFGPILPEIACAWNHDDHIQPVLNELSSLRDEHLLIQCLLNPGSEANRCSEALEPILPSSLSALQKGAAAKILRHRVSFLSGPVQSGRSTLLAALAANFLKAGKRVLYVAPDAEGADEFVIFLHQMGKDLSIDVANKVARLGLPAQTDDEVMDTYSHERTAAQQKAEKRKAVGEPAKLLEHFWNITIQQALHQDYYTKLAGLQDQHAQYKQQLEKVEKEVAEIKENLAKLEGSSMLDRLKKGFSKQEQVLVQRQLKEKEAVQKRLQATHQALANDLLKWDVRDPIPFDDMKTYRIGMKRIEELGGLSKVQQIVEASTVVDEKSLLQSKLCVVTTATHAVLDAPLGKDPFDVIIADEAEWIQIAAIFALAARAREQLIIAGDPFPPGPESYTNTPAAQKWLQRSIFWLAAGSDEFEQFLAIADGTTGWLIFLGEQLGEASKVWQSLGAILFQEKVKRIGSSKTKGKIYFVNTSDLRSTSQQYVGKKKILPYNDLQTKKTMEVVKHALMEPQRVALDVGVVHAFPGPSLFTKLQLRMLGIRNIEVGLPSAFRGRRKKAVIFDTTMAGVDYSLRAIDDRKTGASNIARLFYTLAAGVEEDLYIVADLTHFKSVYPDRFFTKLLMLLHSEATPASIGSAAKKFDDLEWDKQALLMGSTRDSEKQRGGGKLAQKESRSKMDLELELCLKMMASKKEGRKVTATGRDYGQEILAAVRRVLGLLEDLNLLSQSVGGDVLFHHALSTEGAAARLPIDTCEREEDFSAIMERWDLLIYEMSGAAKTDAVYFAKQTPEARVRWDINNLKAYYGSDIQALLEEGKQRIAVAVSKLFQDAISKPQAGSPAEWSGAYLFFLSKLEAYLGWISEQLRK